MQTSELADHFIRNQTNNCKEKVFQVEWVTGDTTETIDNLKTGKADVGITYSQAAEKIAIDSGIASGCEYCHNNSEPCFRTCSGCKEKPCYTFRDHFLLTGPKNNTPKIDKADDIKTTFTKLYNAAENGTARFLTRFDKSATNIKDSELWISIGQVCNGSNIARREGHVAHRCRFHGRPHTPNGTTNTSTVPSRL